MTFLITSTCRTGTKWLAWLMNYSSQWEVVHELPYEERDHFGIIDCNQAIKYQQHRWSKIGVIFRDMREQIVSHFNHHVDTGKHPWGYIDFLREKYGAYVHGLDRLLEEGAQFIHYNRFNDLHYVNQIMRDFGIHDFQAEQKHLDTKVNQAKMIAKSYDELPRVVRQVAEQHFWYQEKYGSCDEH